MAKQDQLLTTGEFATKAGITASAVTKLIRAGKIKAEKKSGKWMISPAQLKAPALKDSAKPGKKVTAKKTAGQTKKKTTAKKHASPAKDKDDKVNTAKGKTYTVAEFAGMTYLTDFGVREWLKLGRLTGHQGAGGEWEIDAANLEQPGVKRLVRQD